MQGHGAALPLVGHLNLEAEHVAELALEGGEIGVDRALRLEHQLLRPLAGALRTGLRLADGKAPGDDVPGQRLRVGRSCDGTRMAHTDIAIQ
jgi:hypothetical protein